MSPREFKVDPYRSAIPNSVRPPSGGPSSLLFDAGRLRGRFSSSSDSACKHLVHPPSRGPN
eukprot:7717950-Alexandrium_andersonii.AAC.1